MIVLRITIAELQIRNSILFTPLEVDVAKPPFTISATITTHNRTGGAQVPRNVKTRCLKNVDVLRFSPSLASATGFPFTPQGYSPSARHSHELTIEAIRRAEGASRQRRSRFIGSRCSVRAAKSAWIRDEGGGSYPTRTNAHRTVDDITQRPRQ